jgi:hypothetical protein
MFALGLWLNSSLRVGADLRLKLHCEGQRSSISSTRVRLRKVPIKTNPASTPRFSRVDAAACRF